MKPTPKPEPASLITESWWTRKEFLENRAKFQERLVAEEIRLANSRFGGAGRYHDSGVAARDERR